MKAITLWQPWSSLVMIGAKPFEFRPKSYLEYIGHPPVGAEVVMHAAKRPMRYLEVDDLIERLDLPNNPTGLDKVKALPFLLNIAAALARKEQPLPLGAGLGTFRLGEPQMADQVFPMLMQDSDRGLFNSAWPCTDVKRWQEPVPCRGLRGFWDWPFKVAA